MKLPRFHLFEFEDLGFFPKFLRGYITDLLTYQIVRFGIYESVVPKIVEVLERSGQCSLVDLCSGSGGPAVGVAERLTALLGRKVSLYLTDKYPNKRAFEGAKGESVTPVSESVDARDVPSHLDLRGMRTLFTSFHHFAPQDAKRILQDSVDKNAPIGIFEITERKWSSFATLLIAPLACLVFSLFLRPIKAGRLFWTYLFPIVPVLYTWDGIVSNLRTHTKEEWMEMAAGLKGSEYVWETGELVSKFHIKVSYLIGYLK